MKRPVLQLCGRNEHVMTNVFVFLPLKRWFQLNCRTVTTLFASVLALNNWEMIAETRSYILDDFPLSSTPCLLKLPPKRTLFINDISGHLPIFSLIFNKSSTSYRDKYVLLYIYFLMFTFLGTKKTSAFNDELDEIKLGWNVWPKWCILRLWNLCYLLHYNHRKTCF